jgi:putative aldouronate transport system substrate-binding protein
MDAMVVPFQDLSNYVNSGQIEPLDELLSSHGSTILELNEEFDMTAGAVIGGQSYGFSTVQQTYGFRGGFVMRKDYFEETGVETKEQYTYDDMTAIFAGIKEKHPECYPYGVLGSGVNSSMTTSGFLTEFDLLGSSIQSGVLTSPDSTTIVNLFETDRYKEFLRYSREWYEAGYIMPDAATSDAIAQELLISGKTACYAMNMEPHQTTNTVAQFGWEAVGLNMTEGYLNSTSPSTNIMWTVPVTAKIQKQR